MITARNHGNEEPDRRAKQMSAGYISHLRLSRRPKARWSAGSDTRRLAAESLLSRYVGRLLFPRSHRDISSGLNSRSISLSP
jgi:hypothetical protein